MNISLKSLFTFIVFTFIGFSGNAQQNLSLSDAIQLGLKNNFQIQIADIQTEIAQTNNNWATAGRYPTVDINLSLPSGYNSQRNPVSFLSELDALSTGVTPAIEASMILFDGYRVKFTKSQLEKIEELNRANAEVVVEDVLRNIILAYQAALIQKEQLGVLEEVLKLSRDRIDYQEVKKEFGQAGTFDILQNTDAYLNDSTSFLVQKNSYEIALRNLNFAMRVENLGTTWNLTNALVIPSTSYQLARLREKMLSNNRQLQTATVNQDLSKINTQIQESRLSPTISVGTGANYNKTWSSVKGQLGPDELDTNANSSVWNYYLNLNASYRLYDAGNRKRNIQNAQKEEIIAQLNMNDLKSGLTAQLENTLATYNNQRELVKITQTLINNAEKNLEIAEERFKGGLINSFDYRSIQLSYINASQSRLNAIFNLKNTEVELTRLTGGLVR